MWTVLHLPGQASGLPSAKYIGLYFEQADRAAKEKPMGLLKLTTPTNTHIPFLTLPPYLSSALSFLLGILCRVFSQVPGRRFYTCATGACGYTSWRPDRLELPGNGVWGRIGVCVGMWAFRWRTWRDMYYMRLLPASPLKLLFLFFSLRTFPNKFKQRYFFFFFFFFFAFIQFPHWGGLL